jgi:hypothetical protein
LTPYSKGSCRDFTAYNYPPGIIAPSAFASTGGSRGMKVNKVYNGLVVDLKDQKCWVNASNTVKNRWTSPSAIAKNNGNSQRGSNIRIQRR